MLASSAIGCAWPRTPALTFAAAWQAQAVTKVRVIWALAEALTLKQHASAGNAIGVLGPRAAVAEWVAWQAKPGAVRQLLRT